MPADATLEGEITLVSWKNVQASPILAGVTQLCAWQQLQCGVVRPGLLCWHPSANWPFALKCLPEATCC